MSRTLTGWSFWGTRGSRGTEAPARQPGTRVNPLQRAGPIRVRAEIPSVTRKRAFLNHAEKLSSGLTLIDLSFRRGQGKRHPGAERCGVVTAETARRGRGICFVDVSLCGRGFLEFNQSDETKKLLDCSHGMKVQQASASLRRRIDWLRRHNCTFPIGLVKNNWEDAQNRRTTRGGKGQFPLARSS